jgi:hypothetical protein
MPKPRLLRPAERRPVVTAVNSPAPIPVFALGMALSTFLAISFVLCVAGYLLLPSLPINHALLAVLPGVEPLRWSSFFVGLVESLAWGWYVALIFAPSYNYFVLSRR